MTVSVCDQAKVVVAILLLQYYLKRQIDSIKKNCC